MARTPSQEWTQVLEEWSRGGTRSAQELLPLVYEELRILARARLARERPGQTLEPTALVHEAWLRIIGDEDPGWKGKGHFFGAAALAMRRILVEQARRKSRLKHGGQQDRVSLSRAEAAVEPPHRDILAVEEAVLDARHRVVDGIRWIRGMATIASAAGLVGAMAHYFFPPVGSLGVRALSSAVVQDAANRGAMISIALGIGTAAVLHVCSSELRRAARARLGEIVMFAAELLEGHG